MGRKTTVLFVCNSNRGKSQMAAALMDLRSGGAIRATSAGVKAEEGKPVNSEATSSLQKIGADMSGGYSKPLSPELLKETHRIVVVGAADLGELSPENAAKVERWKPDEPSIRGIEGEERMDLLRDDIDQKIKDLLTRI
ncbi:MAG: low molecular weight phosphatase family protein [Rothia sp. (in: high G+C Gram-positive bacteria)]|nr:low molecular weight phosphatase family protein [Rothia sp. (in: high G+C Gram-positive bacteria)]